MAVPRPDLEGILGHPVPHVVAPIDEDAPWVAVSAVGDPPRVRAAWVRHDSEVPARIACPPGVPSPARPVVGAVVAVDADGVSDRLLLARAAPNIPRVRVLIAAPEVVEAEVGPEGLVAVRLPDQVMVVAVEALGPSGDSVGRLEHAGLAEIRSVAGRLEGRTGATHGMAAGFGAGDTVPGLADAELEAGDTARLPTWLPDALEMSTVRVEPEAAYPFAPPSIAIAWTGTGDQRILIRQAPAPLAVPELPDARGRAVDIRGATGVLRGRGRGMAFLVWQDDVHAFGLQARGLDDIDEVALRVARSIPSAGAASKP